MGEQKTALILLLILCFTVVSISQIGIVKAESAIYIRADGSVEGTDKIQRAGDVYTLTGNISGGIQVQKSYIVLDGAGYAVQVNKGEGGKGIDLSNGRGQDPSRTEIVNVTIKNMLILNFSYGIYNRNTSNNTIIGNYITNCSTGIDLLGSSNTIIKNNTIANNFCGIDTVFSMALPSVSIIENNMINDVVSSNNGIWMFPLPQYNIPLTDRNYWSDYDGTDADGDGIGDTPYLSLIPEGETGCIDYHPLMEPVETPIVIPEFPSWIILPLFLVATLAALICKRRLAQTPNQQ